LLNVVAYQVWQFAEGAPGPGTEQILQTLVEHWPDDVDLRFYLAELYHRRGDLDGAEVGYRRVLEQDPKYAAAMLRLGMVSAARGGRAAVPTETLEGCQTESEMVDRVAVSTLLGIPVTQVELGPNLFASESALPRDQNPPTGWRYDVYPGKDGRRGLFIEGSDDLALGRKSLRIDSLWPMQSRPDTGPFAEYSRAVMAGPGKHLITVRYSLRTSGQNAGFIDWYDSSVPNAAASLYADLPPTRQCESAVRHVVDGPARAAQTVFLFRLRSDGSLSMADVSIRPITIVPPGQIENTGS
jgi:hypothetical protein